MLYAGVRREVQEHLARQCDEQLVSLFALDAQAARIADALLDKGKGKEVDGEMTAALGLLPASPASAAILASIPAGERFLHAVAYVWDDHCSCMGKLRDVLKYVVRVMDLPRTVYTSLTTTCNRYGSSAWTSSAIPSCAARTCRCGRTCW